jgi:acylphosphatase
MKKRVHIYYSGRVQGVGFRFTAERVAQQLGLTGWVRNLPDGRVEIVCEGKEEELYLFLNKIKRVMGGYIAKEDIDWMEATNEFEGFSIQFF